MNSKKNDYEDEQQDEEDFRCPKCKWYFSTITKPYILPCNHHICLKCIDQLISENRTICPICNSLFNKEERNSFQINIVFLNILIKILQSKIILCENCNKIFYWKEHYNTCDQSFFVETNDLFNKIKLACEESIKLIKLFNHKSNILFKYKKNIIENIKRTLIEISDTFKKDINIGFKKLFFTSKKIDFAKNKKEIISFLELCLQYNKYFDGNEIIGILQKYNLYNSPQKNFYLKNKYHFGFSPIRPEIAPFSPYNAKIINMNNLPSKKTSTLMIPKMNNQRNHTIQINKNDNEKNNFRVIKNNNNMREAQNYNLFNKMINDNNIMHNLNIENSKNKQNFYIPRQNSKTVFYSSNTKPKNKKNKFNIYDILNEDEPNEENDKKKIIVGLKDVKVISNNNNLKKENEINKIDKNKNIIHLKNKNLDIPERKKNSIYINQPNYNNNDNSLNDDSEASTLRIENPSLSLLRSTEFTKRIFPLNANDKRKKLIKYQKACEKIDKEPESLENKISKYNKITKSNKISNSYACLINKNYSISKYEINNKISLSSMNKLFKHFNKIKDIVNEINSFNEFLIFISNEINKGVDLRLFLLGNFILNNYCLLLNEITYNFSQTSHHSIASFIFDTKRISIYNTNLNKFITKDFEDVLPQINSFNNSISLDYDDSDLIFISGGIEESKYFCSDIFIILKWSTENIEYKGNLPDRRAYHSTYYYDNKLYLIGGMDSNKKVSKECHVFSILDKKWHPLPNLNVGRSNSSICIYNNKILYVFRGRDDNNVIDSIEFIKLFNLRSSWKLFKPIDYGYVWNSAENSLVMTIDKGQILICGGEDKDGNLLNDTFLFETNSRKIYKGVDLAYPASFKNNGCYNKGKYFCIDIKNEKYKNIGSGGIHIFDIKDNTWTLN